MMAVDHKGRELSPGTPVVYGVPPPDDYRAFAQQLGVVSEVRGDIHTLEGEYGEDVSVSCMVVKVVWADGSTDAMFGLRRQSHSEAHDDEAFEIGDLEALGYES
jgi:hypothetical protein